MSGLFGAIFMLITYSLSWQPYTVVIGQNKHLDAGFEVTGIPEGIPSQAKFLDDYCSASVRHMSNTD